MNKILIEDVVTATNGKLLLQGEKKYIEAVKHDSRECGDGDMFVAIIGENQDGHKYIPQALSGGCGTLLVSHSDNWLEQARFSEANVILVEDTLYALGELAKYYLSTLDVKKVAVTGSVGKTSVRDMIYYVLSQKYNCGRNMKNFNNFVGLPLSIFQFDSRTEAVVLEMGMDKFGEIDRLGDIVKPHIAVITNIGLSHIENLGSREGIFKAKMEIARHITGTEKEAGALVFAADDEFLTKEMTKGKYRQISIGQDDQDDYRILAVDDFGIDGIQFTLEYLNQSEQISLPIPGRHSAVNASLAVAVGSLLGVTSEEVRQGLSETVLTGSRLKILKSEKLGVIDDTYNASPASMKSALKVLENSKSTRKKIAILGDMYELGHESECRHFEVGAFARGLEIDTLIAIGSVASKIAEGAAGGDMQVMHYEKKEEFYADMDRFVDLGDIILVKGSRGMNMELVVEKLLEF